MDLGQSVHARLTNYAPLTALVGTRVYPTLLPQGVTFPAVNYLTVSNVRSYSHQGRSYLARARVQISCWAETVAGAKAVARQARAALEAFTGALGGAGGVEVGYLFVANEVDLHDPETGRYQVALDFVIGHLDPP